MNVAPRQTPDAGGAGDGDGAADLRDVLDGLSRPQKTLPCRMFYDAAGSELFEQITRLPEYYLTRTELAILARYGGEMVADMPEGGVLVELGSGSSEKTELLLTHLGTGIVYNPIDVSEAALHGAVARLRQRMPDLRVHPLHADFTTLATLPTPLAGRSMLGFFPGSTIGNFAPEAAVELLAGLRRLLGDGRLIVGFDLLKEAARLLPAYDDASGVTAAFNANILSHINRVLDATFDVAAFRHEARFDAVLGRVEMHLVSDAAQTVLVAGHPFGFRAGETILTESCYKYTVTGFAALAERGGWRVERTWHDTGKDFAVVRLA